jgi:hypothetical protein
MPFRIAPGERRHHPQPRTAAARFGALLAGILLLGLASGLARSDQTLLADADAKAGLVFQFARYAEWPAGAKRQAIQICLAGNQDSFLQAVVGLAGKQIRGQAVTVRALLPRDDPATCNVLVIGEGKEPVAHWLNRLRGNATLTISDEAGFIGSGGMIGLAMAGDKVRFEVNLDAMAGAGISLPAQVVRLARNYSGRSE